MRKEIKVAFVAALVVIVGAIFFFINQGKKAGNATEVVPMNAPAQTAAPGAAKTEPARSKVGDRSTPARPSPTAGEQRPIITPPPGRTPSPTTQPAAARPPTTRPVASPLTPRPTLTPKPAAEHEAATQPRPMPELPPLAATGEPATRLTPAPESPTTLLTKSTPVVSPPPRTETERPAATPLPRGTSAASKQYTVAEGESLWSIAEEQYGDGYLWTKLLAANPGIDELVKVGQVINLPPKEVLLAPAGEVKPGAKPASTPAAAQPGAKPAAEARPNVYVVEKNDTLYSIAAKALGNGNRWRELLELNKDKLSRPEELKIGMELKLPAKEGASGKSEPAKTGSDKTEPKKSGPSKKS
jgi:nucleoid-associated protein YgaU